jgi:hypothetical protein
MDKEEDMKNMKHTPGPWRVNRDREIVAADDSIVAWGYHEDMGALLQRIKLSNARLIAAAPDLLEALSALLRRLDVMIEDVSENPEEASAEMEFARTAIAKATGKD